MIASIKNTKERGSAGISPLLGLVLVLVGLWVLWYFTGGPERAKQNTGYFENPPAPLDNGQVYTTPTY